MYRLYYVKVDGISVKTDGDIEVYPSCDIDALFSQGYSKKKTQKLASSRYWLKPL